MSVGAPERPPTQDIAVPSTRLTKEKQMSARAEHPVDELAMGRRRGFRPARSGSIQVEPERDRVRVRCAGAVDSPTAGALRDECEGLLDRGFSRLVLDLSEATSMGPAAVSAIARIDRRARALGSRLSVAPGVGNVATVLHRSGLLGQLELEGAHDTFLDWSR
jgi:anti-anti-sigma factor